MVMKVLELFSGYGTDCFALKRLGIPHEVIGYSDIDKYANKCFQQNHGGKELGDVRKINPEELEDFDLLSAGFPCQAFSMAGKRKGELDTRGTLFHEIIRIAEVKKPKYMLLENVKGLTTKKFEQTFKTILSELERIGYLVNWKVLNSCDYGTPQNRERIFFVCRRVQENEVIDIFNFPKPISLEISMYNLLDVNVDKKYNLSEKMIAGISKSKYRERQPQDKNVCATLKVGGDKKCIRYGNTIRRLTPIEYFKLMGFKDGEINLDGLSDTQRYKLAGNGQDVNVVTAIYRELFYYKLEE